MSEELEDEVWTCRDGRKLLVKDMDETHVRNALRMILRTVRQKKTAQAVSRRLLKASVKSSSAHLPDLEWWDVQDMRSSSTK